jgi:hypothetical protein
MELFATHIYTICDRTRDMTQLMARRRIYTTTMNHGTTETWGYIYPSLYPILPHPIHKQIDLLRKPTIIST